MKKFILFLMIVTTKSFSYAQYTFQKAYGSANWDWANDVSCTADSGYLLLGSSDIVGLQRTKTYLVKTGSQGELKWTKIYDNTTVQLGTKITHTLDSNFIIAAQGSTSQVHYPILIKIDNYGNVLYAKNYSWGLHSSPRDIFQTMDSGIVMIGESERPHYGSFFVFKTDKTGDVQWSKSYSDTSSYNHVKSIIQTSDGGYAYTGTFRLNNSNPNTYDDVLLVKLNSVGDISWTKVYIGALTDMAQEVIQTSDGGYMIVGTISNVPDNYEVCLIKTDPNGDTLWTRTFGGLSYEEGFAVKQLENGSYIVFGQTQSFGVGDLDCYLLKVDSSGNLLWSKKYGGPNTDFSYGLQLTSDGGFVLAGGGGNLGPGSYDVYLIKTDSTGYSSCFETITPTTRSYIPIVVSSAPLIDNNAGYIAYNYPIGIQTGGFGMDVCRVDATADLDDPKQQIVVTPNPFNTEIRINCKAYGEALLFDVSGNIILRQIINSDEVLINTSNISSGFYILGYSVENSFYYFKMIKP